MHVVAADIYITEVMHSPNQMSDNDGEWIELYNDGSSAVDVSNWTINEKEFDDVVIESGEYLIVARELIDDDDQDRDSFRSYWGDESFRAIDGSLSLTSEGSITLSGDDYIETVSYNSSFGGDEGKSIERLSLSEWQEGEVDGSPGSGSFASSEVSESDGSISVNIEVSNSVPEIVSVNFSVDDSSAEGWQVMPNVGIDKEFTISVQVNDSNGLEDVESVSLILNNVSYNLSFFEEDWYQTEVSMSDSDLAAEYQLNISVSDGSSLASSNVSFEYLGMISTSLNLTSLDFSLEPGESEERSVEIINYGNVAVNTEVSLSELVSEGGSIDASNLEVYSDAWTSLEGTVVVGLDLSPGKASELLFRMSVPYSVDEGLYTGSIVVNSVEV
tara:strand:- start:752 stop:1912 length:1161 start_codon:yes stop_codon:yes gene_type:complete